ncbi:hypothetical protein [Pseudomonas baetica]|uniref:hypothetical protein n=1 Tax=Pseudomonas baetica TaxID=674054 RepID=UPI0028726249|nr:hypothetical protein [Pseudomonas baetica]MDR9863290.1 hypothetical protein [Pseudomonas baetica]
MDRSVDTTLTDDIAALVGKYWGKKDIDPHSSQLKALFKQMKDAADEGALPVSKQISIAIETCPDKSANAKRLDALREKQKILYEEACALRDEARGKARAIRNQARKLRDKETLDGCADMCIQFEDLDWSDYYTLNSNIKYPDVRQIQPKVCGGGLVEYMKLFDLLQSQREQCCSFDPLELPDFTALVEKFPTLPAILIPSGGRQRSWLETVKDKPEQFWWYRFAGQVPVVFLVSNEDISDYRDLEDVGVTLVGYDGFGIGCGRAAGVRVAERLNRLCFMADDRTRNLFYSYEGFDYPVTLDYLQDIGDLEKQLPWISGVGPKGELNILTIINPKTSETAKVAFPKYFIASKEDKALARYCEMLRLFAGKWRVGLDTGMIAVGAEVEGKANFPFHFRVEFDANNPPYANVPDSFTGVKDKEIGAIVKCDRYKSLGNNSYPIDWARLSTSKGFLNRWDAVKMQDSAMYLLLTEICAGLKAKKIAETLSKTDAEDFKKYITPWFS